MPISDIFIILKWWSVIFLIGLSSIPLTIKLFPTFFDKGYIFSKTIGIIFISYLIFISSTFHLLSFSRINSILILILIFAINYSLIKISKKTIKQIYKIIIIEEILFFICLFLWSAIRATSPDIRGLEKFMDLGFINSVLRSDFFPAKDLWLTPQTINYYYFGHIIIATLTKISEIKSYITFNLAIATMFAFTFTFSFSIGANLISKLQNKISSFTITSGIISAFFVSFGGNLQSIYAFFKPYTSEAPPPFWQLLFSPSSFPNSYWYPNATRFIYHTIHEFPIYSFVVSDLHAHVLSLPFVLLMIALLLSIFNEGVIRKTLAIAISLTLAVLYMTNTWDIATYFFLTLIVSLFIYWKKKSISSLILYLGSITALTFILTIPFNLTFKPFSEGIGILCAPSFLLKIRQFGPLIFEPNHCQISPLWQLMILYGFFIFSIISFIIFLKKSKPLQSDYFVLILIFASIILILLPEFIYIKDIYSAHYRANTMFKFTYQAFIMLSISSSYILLRIVLHIKKNKLIDLGNLIILIIGSILSFFIFSYSNFAINSFYSNLRDYKTIDGQKYLQSLYPEDYIAINWINSNIKNQPVILEAQGDSYSDYARISVYTGLPTVLGWTVHEWLWRGSYDVVAPRILDVKTIYQTQNIETAKQLLKKYNVSYIYIGSLEYQKYPLINDDKFSKLGEIIFKSGDTKIYKITY